MDRINTTSARYVYRNSSALSERMSRIQPHVANSAEKDETAAKSSQTATAIQKNSSEISASDQAVIEKLQARDRDVKAHEMAHVAAGGQYVTSGINFSYQKGPDGIMYAVGGEVGIDLSDIPGNPQATIAKMIIVRNAALAPSDPSPQDRSVASSASRAISAAQTELMEMQSESSKETSGNTRVNGEKPYENSSAPEKGGLLDISA